MLIDIFDFIKQLQLKKLFTISQYRFIENIFFYINDLVVYKFVISVNPKMLKKAKKFGLNQPYIIHTNDFEHVKIKPFLKNSSFEASGLCPSGCKQSLRPSGPLDRSDKFSTTISE